MGKGPPGEADVTVHGERVIFRDVNTPPPSHPRNSPLTKWFYGKFWGWHCRCQCRVPVWVPLSLPICVVLALPVSCAPVSTRAKPVAHFFNGLLWCVNLHKLEWVDPTPDGGP